MNEKLLKFDISECPEYLYLNDIGTGKFAWEDKEPESGYCYKYIRSDVVATDLIQLDNKHLHEIANFMIDRGFITGHGDTVPCLLGEMAIQIDRLKRNSSCDETKNIQKQMKDAGVNNLPMQSLYLQFLESRCAKQEIELADLKVQLTHNDTDRIKNIVWEFLQQYHLFPNGTYERAAMDTMVNMLKDKGFLKVIRK